MASVLQGCINKDLKVSSRGNKTPMQLLTGLVPKNGIDHILWLGVDAGVKTVTSEEVLREMPAVHDALEELWTEAVDAQQRRRQTNANARDRGVLPLINIGDYVLVAKKVSRSKLSMVWTGPHEIVDTVNPFTFATKPLGSAPNKKPHLTHIV